MSSLPKLYKPGEAAAGQTFSACIYGRGGVGKTTLLGSMPGKGLVIDVPQIEGGTFVLEDHADRIDVVPVTEWDEIDPIYWYLAKEDHGYQWVAVDSITAMQTLAQRKTVKERPLDADPHTISLQEYGKIGQLMKELVYRFRTLPIHVIWIAQERSFGSLEETSGKTIGPDVLPGALQGLLPSMILVGRLYVHETAEGWERRLRIGPSDDFYTKARAKPGLDVPPIVKDPSLYGIIRFLLGRGERPQEAKDEVFTLFAS